MNDIRFLKFSLNNKTYLCSEDMIERIVCVSGDKLFLSPFGPEWLKFLIPFENIIVPVIKEHGEIILEKMYNIVIMKKFFNFIGLIVDNIFGFVKADKNLIDSAISAPEFLAKKVLYYNEKECFLLDIDALFLGGKE